VFPEYPLSYIDLSSSCHRLLPILTIFHASKYFEHTPFATHFWSLAIEEQFYLVWPLAIFYVPANYFKKFLLLVIIAGPIIRFLVADILNTHMLPSLDRRDVAIYVLPFSHFDAFAMGG
jgi:peptidoglycan/LPS O-acetylase OafA/YrhL